MSSIVKYTSDIFWQINVYKICVKYILNIQLLAKIYLYTLTYILHIYFFHVGFLTSFCNILCYVGIEDLSICSVLISI